MVRNKIVFDFLIVRLHLINKLWAIKKKKLLVVTFELARRVQIQNASAIRKVAVHSFRSGMNKKHMRSN